MTEVNVGELVAARFTDEDSTYYRAKVLGETEDGKVDLYFVDYGDNAFTEKKDIFRLRLVHGFNYTLIESYFSLCKLDCSYMLLMFLDI